MSKEPHILVVDDDPTMAKIIEKVTGIPGFAFKSVNEVLASLGRLEPVAAFVDIHLESSQSGLEIIPILRGRWPVMPILVLTSDKTEVAIESALAAGADDFLRKPISPVELQARLGIRLEERSHLFTSQSLRFADFTLTPAHHRLSANGKTVYLSPTALNLLTCLIDMKGTTVSRDVLKRKVWGRLAITNNALDRKVYEVRKIIESVDSKVQIKNIYGQGYQLEGNEKPQPVPSVEPARRLPSFKSKTGAPVRVLLIEDSEADAVIVREALRKGDGLGQFELKRAASLKDGLGFLQKGDIDIVLLDLSLPDVQGFESFQKLFNAFPNVPTVILSGNSDNKLALETVSKGAQDFLSKDEIRPLALSKTIRYAVSRFYVSVLEKSAMREKQCELEKLSELKSQFLAHMSHEIRTPLNAVLGMTSLLLQSNLSPEQLECMNTIRSSSEALLEILNEILDLSKIQAGKSKLEETNFNIRQIIEEVIDLFSGQVCEKGTALMAGIDPRVPTNIFSDPTRMRQILVNLVGNAVKFTTKGEITLLCTLGKTDPHTLHFEVCDTGIGIPEEDRIQLFEPFSQGNISATKRFGGTGLGLVISKKIIESMGGSIGLESIEGKGSTFFFNIPLKNVQQQIFAPRQDLSDKKILIYLQNEKQRDFITTQITARGPSITVFSSKTGWEPHLKTADLLLVSPQSMEEAKELIAEFKTHPLSLPLLWLLPRKFTLPELEEEAVLRVPYAQSRLYEKMATLMEGKEQVIKATSVPKRGELPKLFPLPHPLLVAEDNPVNQRVIKRMLDKLSIKCVIVGNGNEAVEAIQRQKFSAVIMDLSMPEKDGWTATQEIRQKGFTLPIIAMTAHAYQEDREKCFKVGMDHYLAKPVTLEALAEVLSRISPQEKETHSIPSGKKEEVEQKTTREVLNLKKMSSGLGEEDPSFILEMIKLFVDNAPTTLKAIHHALSTGDLQRITSQAHRLKGMALNLGADQLADTCEKIEKSGRDQDLKTALSWEENLDSKWNELQAHITRHIKEVA